MPFYHLVVLALATKLSTVAAFRATASSTSQDSQTECISGEHLVYKQNATDGIPPWLTGFINDGALLVSKILGDIYTPKTLLAKKKPLIKVGENVSVHSKEFPVKDRICTLLHRAGQPDGKGETVVQIWKCDADSLLYMLVQRACGSKKYIQSDMVHPQWPELVGMDGNATSVNVSLKIKSYEDYKLNKLWNHYGFHDTLQQMMERYPDHTMFMSGASRGATLSEIIGFRFALAFRNHSLYKMPYVVSTGAYRWTNEIGRNLVNCLLPQHFAHLFLSKPGKNGQPEFDFVSRVPWYSRGFVDMVPSYHIDKTSGVMKPCVPSEGCPGPDLGNMELLHMPQNFKELHKSIQYMHAVKRMMRMNLGLVPAAPDLWANWNPEQCNLCMGIPIDNLRQDSHAASPLVLGCVENDVPMPECDVDTAKVNIQAGGHIGDFYALRGGRVAKRWRGFDEKGERAVAAKNEWKFYMQTWCRRNLWEHKDEINMPLPVNDPLDPFALGENPWAPRFFGLCQLSSPSGERAHFLVMENLLDGFRKASQFDLKVGQTMEPLSQKSIRGVAKSAFQGLLGAVTSTKSNGARLAGYRVWRSKKKVWRTSGKMGSFTRSLESTFDYVFKDRKDMNGRASMSLLTTFIDRLEQMATWWNATGSKSVRCYAASVLFVWEGDFMNGATRAPVLKFIDYAHFHALADHPNWPDDGTAQGVNSALAQLNRLANRSQ
eukprot:TRINITY_DN75265_c0_g1_i1.p1 TRINITY_DN75265_c0_g1~~TRINITY_DN75265_c0_g1_i1.p1  ORF type:complete len:716 (-),score=106.75 TRINITY_DN75265_c0_g1_i1:55-2202(-)